MAAEATALSVSEAGWRAVSAAFAALGRVFICLDDGYRIIHASTTLDDIVGPGGAQRAEGRPIEELLGADLFGPSGMLRTALNAEERREGWRAQLGLDDSESHVVSVSVAPFPRHLFSACDTGMKSIVVMRPAEEDRDTAFEPTSPDLR